MMEQNNLFTFEADYYDWWWLPNMADNRQTNKQPNPTKNKSGLVWRIQSALFRRNTSTENHIFVNNEQSAPLRKCNKKKKKEFLSSDIGRRRRASTMPLSKRNFSFFFCSDWLGFSSVWKIRCAPINSQESRQIIRSTRYERPKINIVGSELQQTEPMRPTMPSFWVRRIVQKTNFSTKVDAMNRTTYNSYPLSA